MKSTVRAYLCFEPAYESFARMMNSFAVTCSDIVEYGKRWPLAADSRLNRHLLQMLIIRPD